MSVKSTSLKELWKILRTLQKSMSGSFTTVLNCLPTYKATQDIAATMHCFQNNSQIQINFYLFLF